MAKKWMATKYPGVRYREVDNDQWFAIRHTYCGKTKEEGIGWSSDGVTAKKASKVLAKIKHNQDVGSGPMSLAEMRAQEQELQEQAAKERVERKKLPQTFWDLADEFKKWAKNNKTCWDYDHRYLDRHVLPVIGDMRLIDVTAQTLNRYKDSLSKQGLAAQTIVHCLGIIRRCYTFARDIYPGYWEQIAPHGIPTQGVSFPKIQNSRIRYLTQAEVTLIISTAKEIDPPMHDIICLAISTGLRRNEIATLEAGKVLPKQHIILVPAAHAKSRQDESVYVPEAMMPRLEALIENKYPADLVFPSTRTGGPLKSISPRFRKVVTATGLNRGIDNPRDQIVFHTLRHTYISWLVMMGTDIRTVQGMARHRSISMTMRYAHLAPDNISRAANRLPVFGPDGIVR